MRIVPLLMVIVAACCAVPGVGWRSLRNRKVNPTRSKNLTLGELTVGLEPYAKRGVFTLDRTDGDGRHFERLLMFEKQ
jgi:hypothetical protein